MKPSPGLGQDPDCDEQITCLVADDHPAVLKSICDLLAENSFDVVATASTGSGALAAAEQTTPAVALLDLRMPDPDGLEVVRQLRRASPRTMAAVYTGYGDRGSVLAALDAGARGFVLKDGPLEAVVGALRMLAQGRMYIDPVLASCLVVDQDEATLALSARERDVVRLIAGGGSNIDVGKALCISPETVKKHVAKAMTKLGASTRAQMVAIAIRRSLIA